MNTDSSLVTELKDKSYRDAYVASQIRIGLPLQVRALRKSRGWTQPELAEHANMAQPRISEIEKPGERKLNIDTLLRLASAFDVGLEVRFVPFSELINTSEQLDLDNLLIPSFDAELNAVAVATMIWPNFITTSFGRTVDIIWRSSLPESKYARFEMKRLEGTTSRVAYQAAAYRSSIRYNVSNTHSDVKTKSEPEGFPYSFIPTEQTTAIGGNLDG